MLSNELTKKETDYWLEALKQSDIPAAKVNFPEEIFKDKHLQETNFFKKQIILLRKFYIQSFL